MTGFEGMLKDLNLTKEDLEFITESGDVLEFHKDNYETCKSSISGIGVFATKDVSKNDTIGLGTIDKSYKTTLGRYTNHSDNNNAKFYYLENGDVIMIAEKDILKNTEILINYRHHVNEKHKWISSKT